ncbi:MAG: ArsR/SmtB family transcription factor [bacterium]
MSKFIKKGDILRNIPKPLLDKDKDYTEIDNFKNLCKENLSDAIAFLLFDNINYYLTIVNDFHNLSNDFIVGAILDSIYTSIKEINYCESIQNYIRFSGKILKRNLLDEIKTKNYYKRKIDSKNVEVGSYENISRNNVGINEEMIIDLNSPIGEFDKIEMLEAIKKEDLLRIRKEILLMIVRGEGKITITDISKELNVSQQNVSYHLKYLKNNKKRLLNELF